MYDQSAIKALIKRKYKTLHAFSVQVGIPRTTLFYALDKDFSSLSFGTVVKICDALEIPLDELTETSLPSNRRLIVCSDKEYALLKLYREPGMSDAMDKVLGLSSDE